MAISISVLILVIGLISLLTLPVEQYPDIAPPTVYVSAQYTGADAEAVMNSVIMPLEESINGVENMMYITSTASNSGLAIIQVYFTHGRSIRPDVPGQLSGHQCTTSNQTRRGSRRCNGIGRYIQYAYLAETGTDGAICPGSFGYYCRAG